jgi:hypothetical protein
VFRPAKGVLCEFRPDFTLIFPAGGEPSPALAEFRLTLPPEIVAILESFVTHQWSLLELLAARPEAIQLATHNPVLAYLVANNDHFRKNLTKPPAYLAQWRLDYTQERLLEWLGFPGKPAVVKLFRRIEPASLLLATARLLRLALNSDPSLLPLLAHQRRINRGVLSLVVMPQCRAWLTPKLLEEIGAKPDGTIADDPGERLMGLLAKFAGAGFPLVPRALRSLQQLDRLALDVEASMEEARSLREAQRVQDEAQRIRQQAEQRIRAVRRQEASITRLANSSPPPLDSADVIRLKTKADAVQEGQEQRNCVADSAQSIVANKVFIYRVLRPQRATLELEMGEKGWWYVKQLKLARNREVSPLTRAHVDRWLNAYHASVIHRRAMVEARNAQVIGS